MGASEATALRVDQIQGNILGGFNKDYASFLFFALADGARARAWLAEILPEVATADEVRRFNELFKLIRARHKREGVVEATWMNVAFTYPGLQALGVEQTDLATLPEEFRQGMRCRAECIGDVGANAPEQWPAGLGTAAIDALMIVAADSAEDRDREASHFIQHAARHGVTLVFQQDGETRPDAPGHEHFGFRDGISQPGVTGFTVNPIPGQDLIEPGEFVLGYKREGGPGEPDGAIPEPDWLLNGSYLVFRRLAQDVAAFKDFVREAAHREGVTEELLGAKLVGRYRSGAPLEKANNDRADPAVADPETVDEKHINDFEFVEDGDADGIQVPRAAHIRKVYPRDQPLRGNDDADRRRILRRGIPFGQSYHAGGRPGGPFASDAAFPADRGLCFVCYQRSIAEQFEHIQRSFVNDANFPKRGDGVDPLISQASERRSISLPGMQPKSLRLAKQWVTTTGGEYFFSPSIGALDGFTKAGGQGGD